MALRPRTRPPRRVRSVLIVDDDESIRRVLADVVADDLGLPVETAIDGDAALASIARRRPALVFCDLMMPGTDGYEVCRRVKANPATRRIPVILASAAAQRASALAVGCDEFIAKPFEVDRLVDALRRWLPVRPPSIA